MLAQRHDEAGRQILTELLDGWDARLEAILREGRDAGDFADVDLPEFTVRAVAMLSGLSEDVMFGRSRWRHASVNAFALSALRRELCPCRSRKSDDGEPPTATVRLILGHRARWRTGLVG
ncbi:hypothetical protein SCALM49S_08977 [Streptomyces californicus]